MMTRLGYRYTVRCQFTDAAVADRWLRWLEHQHISDVMHAGATAAEIVEMNADLPTYEIRYEFSTRDDFDVYLRDHAPALRDEGLQRFPLHWGLQYSRSDGQVVYRTDSNPDR